MRWGLALGFLGFASLAQAQGLPPADPPSEPKLTVKVTVEQAMLIAQTLGAISCPNVAALTTCQQAADLLRSIKEQAREQQK